MLAGYPLIATTENWLHESLVEMISIVHQCLDADLPLPQWRKLIPDNLQHDQRDKLLKLRGIKDRLWEYCNAIADLSSQERAIIYRILIEQNDVPNLLNGVGNISSLLPRFPDIHELVHSLFVFAYKKLTDLEIRDRQYQVVFESLGSNFCPFCGIERLRTPKEEVREDLDHYLAKSLYPFAAVNLRNLVPMCRSCNRDYKKNKDVIRDEAGKRRQAFDPYDHDTIDIDLKRSDPFPENARTPEWVVDFVPDSIKCDTWDQLLSVRARYGRDVLDKCYNRWIDGFRRLCRQENYPPELENEDILKVLVEHHGRLQIDPGMGMEFLKPKIFEMLIRHFREGNKRVIAFMRDVVLGIQIVE